LSEIIAVSLGKGQSAKVTEKSLWRKVLVSY